MVIHADLTDSHTAVLLKCRISVFLWQETKTKIPTEVQLYGGHLKEVRQGSWNAASKWVSTGEGGATNHGTAVQLLAKPAQTTEPVFVSISSLQPIDKT